MAITYSRKSISSKKFVWVQTGRMPLASWSDVAQATADTAVDCQLAYDYEFDERQLKMQRQDHNPVIDFQGQTAC
jgi:hypothetical protein